MSDLNGVTRDIEWIKNSLLVHTETLQRIEDQLMSGSDRCRGRHEKIDRELGELSVRASIAGAIAGMAAGCVIVALEIVMRILTG